MNNTTDQRLRESETTTISPTAFASATESAIPARHLDFCREVGRLAAAHGLNHLSMTIRPGFHDKWRDEIVANWEQGRHGEDAGIIHVQSTVRVHAKISPNTAQATPAHL